MIQSVVAGATSTYLYEPSGKRIKTVTPSATTVYFNKYFDTVNSTTTDYIYGGDTLYATVEKGPAPSQSPAPSGSPSPSPLPAPNITHYNHSDHLQSVGAILLNIDGYKYLMYFSFRTYEKISIYSQS